MHAQNTAKTVRRTTTVWLGTAILALIPGLPLLWWFLYLFGDGWPGLLGGSVYLGANLALAFSTWNIARENPHAAVPGLALGTAGLGIPTAGLTWVVALLAGAGPGPAAVACLCTGTFVIATGVLLWLSLRSSAPDRGAGGTSATAPTR